MGKKKNPLKGGTPKAKKIADKAISKAAKKAKKLRPHSPAKIAALEKQGAEVKILNSVGDLAVGLSEFVPSEWDAQARTLGLVKQPAYPGSPYMVYVPAREKPATAEQRVFMAKHIQKMKDVGRYIKMQQAAPKEITTSIGETDMAKSKEAIPGTGLSAKDIEKMHAQSVKENAEKEKQQKKDAAKKAKEDEEKRKKESAARKKMKHADVTPKGNPKTAGGHNWVKQNLVSNKDGSDDYMCENCEKKFKRRGLEWTAPAGDCPGKKGKKTGKDADPKAQVKGISSPPVKAKAGMEPGKVPAGGFTKDSKPVTSGELIRARIGEHKLTDDQIAAEVRKLWPGRTTAVSDVRWNRSQMQKAGVKNVPEPVEGSTVPGKRK